MDGSLGFLDSSGQSMRYFRNAVERHWDPATVDLDCDRESLLDASDEYMERFDGFRSALAKFGAGEESVTEDLAPLAVVLYDIEDEMFVTTQMYEEAKHAEFFDRYWRMVVRPVEEARGLEVTSPGEDRWFDPAYRELFGRNEEALNRLLTQDTPENRVRAYTHYHLVIEGILAQTGYYGLTKAYGDNSVEEIPYLPGLVDGLRLIRSDEGRHVGFGMTRLKYLILEEGVSPDLLSNTVNELVGLVQESLAPPQGQEADEDLRRRLFGDLPPQEYAVQKHTERMKQITSAGEEIPGVDELTRIEG